MLLSNGGFRKCRRLNIVDTARRIFSDSNQTFCSTKIVHFGRYGRLERRLLQFVPTYPLTFQLSASGHQLSYRSVLSECAGQCSLYIPQSRWNGMSHFSARSLEGYSVPSLIFLKRFPGHGLQKEL
jgi:hypothetical protein